MKRLILALTLVLASVTAAFAQNSGIWPDPAWCPTCYVASSIDSSPAPGGTLDGSETIWSWAGVCSSGAAPTNVTALAVVNGTPTSVAVSYNMDTSGGGPRSDVRAHLVANGCHGGHAVLAFWFTNGLPSGTTSVGVQIRSGDIYAFHNWSVSSEIIPLSDGDQGNYRLLTVGELYVTTLVSEQQKTNTITVELSDAQMKALIWFAENPGLRGPVVTPEKRTPAEWVALFVQNRMDDIVRQYQEHESKKLADVGDRVKKLNPARCAAIAKELGIDSSIICGGHQ